jgi:hypothetical protein
MKQTFYDRCLAIGKMKAEFPKAYTIQVCVLLFLFIFLLILILLLDFVCS